MHLCHTYKQLHCEYKQVFMNATNQNNNDIYFGIISKNRNKADEAVKAIFFAQHEIEQFNILLFKFNETESTFRFYFMPILFLFYFLLTNACVY